MTAPHLGWRSQLAGGFAAIHILLVLTTAFGPAVDLPGPLGLASSSWNRWHRATRPAMRLYGSLFGPKQSWAMFGSVGHKSAQLRIEVLEAGRWREVFAERSDIATWNRSHFDHYRWREFLWDLGKTRDPKPHLQRFTNWVAPKVFADHPTGSGSTRLMDKPY